MLFLLLLVTARLSAQQPPTGPALITIHGQVFDLADSMASPTPMVVNRRTGSGQSALPGQQFTVHGQRTDTFMISAGGYEVVRVCYRDSIVKAIYNLRVGLRVKVNTLKPVAIYPMKDLNTLRNERETLGVKETRITTDPVDAMQSPITYMYERFSREGRSKAAVAMLENEDRKREILIGLFQLYVRAGVIALKPEEYDAFILYLNIPEAFLKEASDYLLAVEIRERWLMYENAKQMHKRNQR